MTPSLLSASYAGNYRLRLRFADGTEGEVDLADKLAGEMFMPLRDRAAFEQFRLNRELGTVVWPNGVSFPPEFLYQQVRGYYERLIGSPPNIPYASATHLGNPVDTGHLQTIAICHYVWGAAVILFSSIFIIHIVLGLMMVNGKMPMPQGPNAPPFQIGYIFVAMGTVAVLLGWSLGISTIISGRAIARRRWRVFSLVVAGVNCASFPFGTLLGVFTFIVLLRPSVNALYDH